MNDMIDEVFPTEHSVIFFHAHPDDESFLSAGLIGELATRGKECIVVYAAAALVRGERRTVRRQLEAAVACRALNMDMMILYLDFCEPKYSDEDVSPLVLAATEAVSENLREVLRRNLTNGPFVLVSYDRNGGYGNEDHLAVHRAGRRFHARYPELAPILLEVTINRSRMQQWLDRAKRTFASKDLPKLSYWSCEFGLPEEEITYCHCLNEAQLRLKRSSLAAHASQIAQDDFPLSLGSEDFEEVFGHEYLKACPASPARVLSGQTPLHPVSTLQSGRLFASK